MELNQRLWELWQVQEEDRDAAVKVLTTIFGNIAKDPNNAKYRDLNFSKIRKKFEKAKPAFYLMYSAGFGQNVDGSRLVLGLADIKMFHKANESLMKKIANPDDPSLVPASQKAKEPKSGIKDKHFKEKYASSSQAKHEREAREEKEAIERQNSHLNEENENENNNNNDNNNENDENNDTEMGDGSDAAAGPKKVDTRSTEEIEKDNSDVKNALDGLDADDMDLLAQIQSSKDTTVSLSMAELAGKTKEEKIAIFKDKQKQFRKEKAQVERRTQIDREKKRRENVKLAQEAKLKREEQQRAMVARKKQREKQEEKMRKQRIREKIQADKERKQKQKEWEEKKKQQQQQAPQ